MQEDHFYDKERSAFFLSAGIGLVITTLFVKYSFGNPAASLGIETLGNIKTYIISILLWLISSSGIYMAFSKILPSKGKKGISFALAAVALMFFAYMSREAYRFMGEGSTTKTIIRCVAFMLATVLVYSLYEERCLFILKGFILAGVVFYFARVWYLNCCYQNTYTPWSFGMMYNIYHTSAYIDTIGDIYYGHPFVGMESEVYGHYALLMILPLKIMGADTKSIGILMGSFAAISYVSIALALHLSIKQFIVKVASLATIGVSGILAVSMYWQSYPHRLLFPALTLLLIAVFGRIKKFRTVLFILGFIMTTSALIWNFETGILCTIAWSICGTFALGKKLPKIVNLIISFIATVVVSSGAALAILNIYNHHAGGKAMSFMDLVGYSFTSGFVSHQASPVPIGNLEYVHMVILCMICALWGLWKMLIKGESSSKVMTALAVAVFGIGLATYYVNDSDGGPTIIMIYLIMAAALAASGVDRSVDLYSLIKKGLCAYACIVIFVFGAINWEFRLNHLNIEPTQAWEYDSFQAFADDVDSRIAPDTVGGGYGTTALFLAMGRDRGTDDFHFNFEEVDGSEHFIKFWSEEVEFEGYECIDHFCYNGTNFGYFEKIHDESSEGTDA
ncbi:hypothetical protein SAMN06296952_1661 [Oscillospiraceae bacterium]|nr:hypothetical protein SAMN06296952_1661 [Oscillospiraceae bacterium]